MRKLNRTLIAFTVCASSLALAVTGAISASGSEPEGPSEDAGRDIALIDLDHATTPKAAMSLQLPGQDILGFRFEQPGIVGEYYPQSAAELKEFTKDFVSDTNVQPAVVGLVAASTSTGLAARSARAAAPGSSLPRVVPHAIGDSPALGRFKKARKRARASRGSQPQNKTASALSSAASSTQANWAPGYSEIYAANKNSATQISTYSSWDPNSPSGSRKPTNLPTDWGIEFDVTEYNSAIKKGPTDYDQYRPGCAYGHYDEYWAAKRSSDRKVPFNGWSVEYIARGQSAEPSAIGAYADWDDLYDECPNQSMAIGIGLPRSIPSAGSFYDIMTNIYAPKGTKSSSPASAAVQAVSNDCNNLGKSPSSDCMGLNSGRALPNGVPSSQQLLSKARNWTIPRCWSVTWPNDPKTFSCATGPWG